MQGFICLFNSHVLIQFILNNSDLVASLSWFRTQIWNNWMLQHRKECFHPHELKSDRCCVRSCNLYLLGRLLSIVFKIQSHYAHSNNQFKPKPGKIFIYLKFLFLSFFNKIKITDLIRISHWSLTWQWAKLYFLIFFCMTSYKFISI